MGSVTIDTPRCSRSPKAAAARAAPGEPILTVQALTKTFPLGAAACRNCSGGSRPAACMR